MRSIKLRRWGYCYDGRLVIGFMRACYQIDNQDFFNKITGHPRFSLQSIKSYDIIISLNKESNKWHTIQPRDICMTETKTPESLMMIIDLLLLENKLLKDTTYEIDDSFIFPMNDL